MVIDLFTSLHNEKVQYVLCGGLAMQLHGIPRMTMDVDIILNINEKNIAHAEKVFVDHGYTPMLPVVLSTLIGSLTWKEEIKEKNLVAFGYADHSNKLLPLDVLLEVPISFEELWDKKIVRKIGGTEIFIASPAHLIQLKQYASRSQDLKDIELLKKIMQ